MAYWIVKTGSNCNSLLRYFQCDFLSDIDKLPTTTKRGESQENDTVSSCRCASGSQCLCQEDGSVWLLGRDTNKWIQQKGNSGGGISYFSSEPDSLSEGMTWIGD